MLGKRRRLDPRALRGTPGPTACTWAPAPPTSWRVILVVMGADAQGEKHLVALDEAMSESGDELARNHARSQSARLTVLRGWRVADGANGFWAALSASIPEAAQQRCWVHKIRNVLDKVPEKLKGDVHRKLREICGSTTRAEAMSKIDALAVWLSKDYPKAAACVRDDVDRMLAYFAFPKASWKSLRTTNPIESVFSSVRLRTQRCETTAQRHIGAVPRLQVDRTLVDDMAAHQRLSNDRTCARESCMR